MPTTLKVTLGDVPRDVLIALADEHPGRLTTVAVVQRLQASGVGDEDNLTPSEILRKTSNGLAVLQEIGFATATPDYTRGVTGWTATDDGLAALHTTPTTTAENGPDHIASHATRPQTDPEADRAAQNEQGPHMADRQWGPRGSLRTDSNRRPLHYE